MRRKKKKGLSRNSAGVRHLFPGPSSGGSFHGNFLGVTRTFSSLPQGSPTHTHLRIIDLCFHAQQASRKKKNVVNELCRPRGVSALNGNLIRMNNRPMSKSRLVIQFTFALHTKHQMWGAEHLMLITLSLLSRKFMFFEFLRTWAMDGCKCSLKATSEEFLLKGEVEDVLRFFVFSFASDLKVYDVLHTSPDDL